MAHDAGADVDGGERGAGGVEVADVHHQGRGHDEVRHDVAVAVQLGADDRERRVTSGRRPSDRSVHDVREARRHVQTHAEVVPVRTDEKNVPAKIKKNVKSQIPLR